MDSTGGMISTQSAALRANIRVSVIQRMYSGFLHAFRAVTADSNDVIEYWLDTVPGFRERIESYVERRDAHQDGKYASKWSVRSMLPTDRNKIVGFFESSDAFEGEDCNFVGPNVLDMYVTCAIFLHARSGKRHTLPKSKKSDKYGLWIGFCDLFAATAETLIAAAGAEKSQTKKTTRKSTLPRKRTRVEDVDKQVQDLKERMDRLEEHRTRRKVVRRNSF